MVCTSGSLLIASSAARCRASATSLVAASPDCRSPRRFQSRSSHQWPSAARAVCSLSRLLGLVERFSRSIAQQPLVDIPRHQLRLQAPARCASAVIASACHHVASPSACQKSPSSLGAICIEGRLDPSLARAASYAASRAPGGGCTRTCMAVTRSQVVCSATDRRPRGSRHRPGIAGCGAGPGRKPRRSDGKTLPRWNGRSRRGTRGSGQVRFRCASGLVHRGLGRGSS